MLSNENISIKVTFVKYKTQILSFLKLILIMACIFLLIYGWSIKNERFSVIGAIFFLFVLTINLILTIIESRRFKIEERDKSKLEKNIKDSISDIFITLTVITGLVTILFDNPLFYRPGMIIWIGTIIFYSLNGAIASWITNIPLKMTYGGWRIDYSRKKKR